MKGLQLNVRHASACRQLGELSMCDVTGNNHCLSVANLDDKLKHVGHLVRVFSSLLHRLDHPGQGVLRVAIKHAGHILEEERVLQSRKTFALATFQYHD